MPGDRFRGQAELTQITYLIQDSLVGHVGIVAP